MLDPEREVEMELDGDSNDVSGSPTTRSPSQFMDYEMFSSLSPLDPSFDYSVSLWNSPSPGRWPQSPEFEISLWNFPSPSRGQPGFSRLISSHGNASSSTQPPVRSPSPPFPEQGAVSLDVVLQRLQQQLQQLLSLLLQHQELQQGLSLLLQRQDLISQLHLPQLGKHQREKLLLEQLLRGIQQRGIQQQLLLLLGIQEQRLLEQLLCCLQQQQQRLEQLLRGIQQQLLERLQQLLRHLQQQLLLHQLEQHLCRLQQRQLGQQGVGLILLGPEVQQQAFFMVQELARLHSLHNKKRALHKFIQNASKITLQIKIKMAHEICEEGHEDTSIQILDKITVVTKAFKLHLSWTKAPCRHSSQDNASDLKKSCTSFDGCYTHQDCMSTAKLEICVDFYVDDVIISNEAFFSPRQFFCSEFTIESQSFHAICEPIAPADDEPDSRCELIHILLCTRSPPVPNGLPDGEEMPQQDSLKHQLMGETHAMNDGENVLSEDGMHSAVSYPENEGTRKTPKRKITIEDLQHFPGSRNDAANHFGVSVPTIKRCLRDHKIKDWRNRNIDKNNRCLSEPKEIMESFPGEESEMGNQMAGGSRSCEREFSHEQIGSDRSQIGVGLMEESSTRLETSPMGNMFASSPHELCVEAGEHSELPELNLSATRLEPAAVNSALPQIPERELLMENSGSSRELSDHYISATEAFNAKQVPDSSWTNLSCSDPAPKLANSTAAHMMPIAEETQDTRIVTVKAKYRDDTVKFKLPLTSGIIELKKEVAKKQELEVDSFSIKYLDDENEWIVMKDDVDLQQCFNDSISLGCNIRLLIHDSANSGAPDKAKGD